MAQIKRLEWIDRMRGIAILLVVIGHLIQFNNWGNRNNQVLEFILSFHMPLFFCISGYITYQTTKIITFLNYISFLKKKAIALLIPLFTWPLIVPKYFFSETWEIISFQDILTTITSPGLWFLLTLFEILVTYGLFHWLSSLFNKKERLYIDIILITLILCFWGGIALLNHTMINIILYSLLFYLGVILSKHKKIKQISMNDICFATSFFLFIILVCHWVLDGDYLDDIYKILISSFAFIVLENICRKLDWKKHIAGSFSCFGKYSLSIYVVHLYLCTIHLPDVGEITINPFWVFFLLAIIASTSSLLDLILFGKLKRKISNNN